MPTPQARPCHICGEQFTPAFKHTVKMCSNRCRSEYRRRARGAGPLPQTIIIDGKKQCSKCKQWKQTAEFSPRKNRESGLHSACKVCLAEQGRLYHTSGRARAARYAVKYGVTVQWYEDQLKLQDGCCAICLRPERADGQAKLSVDHCHKTGQVRGLLCGPCNRAIGMLGDSAETLRRAANYLGKWPGQEDKKK